MSRKFSIAFFLHSIRSDWNNGNAHFLRGLLREMSRLGHMVASFERSSDWSYCHLLTEGTAGQRSLEQFRRVYPDINVQTYSGGIEELRARLHSTEFVIVHEWNPPELVAALLELREELHFQMLFHDTHHRASGSPAQIKLLQVERFDGVVAFGEALRQIYLHQFGLERVWTLHEAADTSVFYPRDAEKTDDVIWIGNWGDEERSQEICDYFLAPARQLNRRRFVLHGVRYSQAALEALQKAGIEYGGYLANLDAPAAYARSTLTVHIPRQRYTGAMSGIPTIRVFEALASGIPLISAPWRDVEELFDKEDFLMVHGEREMTEAMDFLLSDPAAARSQAERGLATVLERHTCRHRAKELTAILEEVSG